jgi:hypothetical protein
MIDAYSPAEKRAIARAYWLVKEAAIAGGYSAGFVKAERFDYRAMKEIVEQFVNGARKPAGDFGDLLGLSLSSINARAAGAHWRGELADLEEGPDLDQLERAAAKMENR